MLASMLFPYLTIALYMIDIVLAYQTTDLNFFKKINDLTLIYLDSFHDELVCLPTLQVRRLEIALITMFRLSTNS